MNHGNTYEPIARDWYDKKYNVKTVEIGFCVPKWDHTIGVSIDGLVLDADENELDGIIEIKCPQKMYQQIKNKQRNLKFLEECGMDISEYEKDYSHIWKTHFVQMQLGMAVLDKKWCDYIVYCTFERKVSVERIYFDQEYWKKLYSNIKGFIKTQINPLLKNGKIPVMPPK